MKLSENDSTNNQGGDSKLNFDQLNQVGSNDPNFLKDMLSTFSTTLSQTIEEIKINHEQMEFIAIADSAHKMAPSCHYLGADQLYNLLKDLEVHCRTNQDRSQIEAEVKSFLEEAKTIHREVNAKIKAI